MNCEDLLGKLWTTGWIEGDYINPLEGITSDWKAIIALVLLIFSLCCFYSIKRGFCKDRTPPCEGGPAVARAKDGYGPYYPVLAVLDNGEEIPGK